MQRVKKRKPKSNWTWVGFRERGKEQGRGGLENSRILKELFFWVVSAWWMCGFRVSMKIGSYACHITNLTENKTSPDDT